MVAFWDSSAFFATIIREDATPRAQQLLDETATPVFWWGTRVELAHALGRRQREGSLSQEDVEDARARFGAVLDRGFEIEPSEEVRAAAIVLALAGTVRSADALQLAAGLTAHRIAGSAAFVTFDDRLAEVARSHGLTVLARIP